MELPTRIEIGGTWYVREDSVEAAAPAALERSYSIPELSKETGFPVSTLYDNVRRGELVAVMPNGTTKGMRVMQGAWERFVAEKSGRSVA